MVSHYDIIKSSVIHPRSDSRNWPRSSEWCHPKGALVFTGSPAADLRCTASSFVISVAECGDHIAEAYSNCGRTNVV